MAVPRWRSRLLPDGSQRPVFSWLRETASLTARCQAGCRTFRIRLLGQGLARPLVDEGGLEQPGRLAAVREVTLECDGVPVIFAHTVLPATPRGRLSRWFGRLGTRSLGSLLFTYPGFSRGPIECLRLDRRHPLFQRAVAAAGLGPDVRQLWARRSRHRLGRQTVLVTEVFLPAITRLG